MHDVWLIGFVKKFFIFSDLCFLAFYLNVFYADNNLIVPKDRKHEIIQITR